MRCPNCDSRVEISGVVFVVLGLMIGLFTGLILDTSTPTIGAGVGAGFVGFGVLRLARQMLAPRRWRGIDVAAATARLGRLTTS